MSYTSQRQNNANDESKNSRCPPAMGTNLYRVIVKNFKDEVCIQHNLQYEYFYQNQFLCKNCLQNQVQHRYCINKSNVLQKIKSFYNLQYILNHPLLLLAKEQQLLQHSIQTLNLIFSSYKEIYHKKRHFQIQKQLLHVFISRIKNKINVYCDQIMAQYDRLAQNISKQYQYKQSLKNINQVYEDAFLQLMSQRQYIGQKQQLQNIFKQYIECNQSPFSAIFTNLDEFMGHLSISPIINTRKIVDLYTIITDQHIWNVNQIIRSHKDEIFFDKQKQNKMILTNQVILQKQYDFFHDQHGIVLKKDGNIVGTLNNVYDSLYHYSKYRLIGINYQNIEIINYFDQLKVQKSLKITGCTDLLAFPSILIAISQEKLLRINIDSEAYEILDINCRDLSYSKEQDAFQCFNSMGKIIRWQLYEKKPMIINYQ